MDTHIFSLFLRITGGVLAFMITLGSFGTPALAGWNILSLFTSYNAGTYGIFAPIPGINTYRAQHATRGVTGTGNVSYDPEPPNLESIGPLPLAADSNGSIPVRFNDIYDGRELSGVAATSVTVSGPTGTSTSYGSTVINVQHDFSKAGLYDINWTATDNVGNQSSGSENDFLWVVAGAAEWDAGNCSGDDYETSCPSTIISSSDTKVSDGSDTHAVDVRLADRYGNRIVSEAGVKDVSVKYHLDNTVALDQIADSGDAARFVASEFSYDQTGANTGTTKLTETDWLTEPPSGDGEYQLSVRTYAPTSSGYPVIGSGIDIALTGVEYRIRALGSNTGVGEEQNLLSQYQDFAFQPALSSDPVALNFDGGSYIEAADAMQNITINAAKRFNMHLSNHSATETVSDAHIGLFIESSDSDVTWAQAKLEEAESTLFFPAQTLVLDTATPFVPGWNTLPTPISSVNSNTEEIFRMQSTPVLASGTTTGSSFDTDFQTFLHYIVGGRNTKHKSGELNAGVNALIHNVNVQIIGTAHSNIGFSTNLDDSEVARNLGDVFINEAKTDVDRNIAAFIASPTYRSRACSYDLIIDSSTNWANLPCAFESGGGIVVYVRDANVVMSDMSGLLTLPHGTYTILNEGGNVHIKSNIVTADTISSSLGIIGVRTDNGDSNPLNDGGNAYIYPQVTNISAALYAEGNVVSTNHAGQIVEYTGSSCPADGSAGFCDRSYELRNQLYWRGLIISQNTIGGSDRSPAQCPTLLSSLCGSRTIARIFDFNYLRAFHETSGGTRAGVDALPDPPDDVNNNYAVIVEYTGNVKANPPPLFVGTGSNNSTELGH